MFAQERQMLADLFERVRAAGSTPRDAEAEAFIGDAVRAQPYAPYVLAQTVLVQQHALEAAQRRIQELEAGANAQPASGSGFLGGLGRSLFGGPAAPAPNTPPPYRPAPQAYAPTPMPAPGPWGAAPSGGGFLSSALTTAAGVAGGIAVADMLGGLFGGHGGGGWGGGFGGAPVHETINNFYEAPAGADPRSAADFADPASGYDASQDAGYDPGADSGMDGGGFDDSGSFDV